MIAGDVTPFGPSEVPDAMVVVELADLLAVTVVVVVVVVVVLLAVEIAEATTRAKVATLAGMIPRRSERGIPRTLFTLPSRWCFAASVVSDLANWGGRRMTRKCSASPPSKALVRNTCISFSTSRR
jgi:hypothetical protein